MAKSLWIARQSAHPRGPVGHLVARVMALETRALNRRVFDALDPQPGDRVLELGCGHGRALREVARRVVPGVAVGADPSAVMRRIATRHLRAAAGRARIVAGHSGHVPEPDASFDRAFSVHTVYFWPDLAAGLREARRLLRPGGLLLLAFHTSESPGKVDALPSAVYTLRSGATMAEAIRGAGFGDVALTVDPSDVRIASARA